MLIKRIRAALTLILAFATLGVFTPTANAGGMGYDYDLNIKPDFICESPSVQADITLSGWSNTMYFMITAYWQPNTASTTSTTKGIEDDFNPDTAQPLSHSYSWQEPDTTPVRLEPTKEQMESWGNDPTSHPVLETPTYYLSADMKQGRVFFKAELHERKADGSDSLIMSKMASQRISDPCCHPGDAAVVPYEVGIKSTAPKSFKKGEEITDTITTFKPENSGSIDWNPIKLEQDDWKSYGYSDDDLQSVNATYSNGSKCVPDADNPGIGTQQQTTYVETPKPIKVTGYLFKGTKDTFKEQISPDAKEPVADYINRLKKVAGEPIATVSLFTAGFGKSYTVSSGIQSPADGTYVNWVWTVTQADQPTYQVDGKTYHMVILSRDFAEPFGLPEQTSELPKEQTPVTITSNASKPTVTIGSEIHDTLHIKGLPTDFGQFKGIPSNPDMLADATKFKVSVWWYDQPFDEKYNGVVIENGVIPVMQEDDHHKKVASNEYDLLPLIKDKKNFDGSLDFQVYGKDGIATVNGEHPTVKASKAGYYVFVALMDYDYIGTPRIRWVNSDNKKILWTSPNDKAETVEVKEIPPTLTTKVSSSTVYQGGVFHDTATLTGTIPEGSYLEFVAYQPQSGKFDKSTAKPLSGFPQKIPLTAEQITASSQSKGIQVNSNSTSTTTAGNVYWQATLKDKDNNVLATHDVGIPEETVTVKQRIGNLPVTGVNTFDMVLAAIWAAVCGIGSIIARRLGMKG